MFQECFDGGLDVLVNCTNDSVFRGPTTSDRDPRLLPTADTVNLNRRDDDRIMSDLKIVGSCVVQAASPLGCPWENRGRKKDRVGFGDACGRLCSLKHHNEAGSHRHGIGSNACAARAGNDSQHSSPSCNCAAPPTEPAPSSSVNTEGMHPCFT